MVGMSFMDFGSFYAEKSDIYISIASTWQADSTLRESKRNLPSEAFVVGLGASPSSFGVILVVIRCNDEFRRPR